MSAMSARQLTALGHGALVKADPLHFPLDLMLVVKHRCCTVESGSTCTCLFHKT